MGDQRLATGLKLAGSLVTMDMKYSEFTGPKVVMIEIHQ
jgi:hypothetical protein